MAEAWDIKNADSDDISAITSLLQNCELPIVNIEKQVNDFIVAKQQNCLVGTLGVVYDNNENVLLRSFAVTKKNRSQGIGKELIQTMLAVMEKKKILNVFLLTETAAEYFMKIGFHEIQRSEIPDILLSKSGLDKACPCSSKCFIYNNI